ncbi:MAG: maleylpyruvate isomerase family mycothiol-dependent enzyme [Kineosporiaceae bacterium]
MSEIPARLLQAEREVLLPLLERTIDSDFDRTTVCTEWSVRDIVAHCSAVLLALASGEPGRTFTPEQNQREVDERRGWPLDALLAELKQAHDLAAGSPAVAPVVLGVWIHGCDIRDALGIPNAYAAPGLPDALALLVERSIARGTPPVDVTLTDAADRGLDSAQVCLGDPNAEPVGWLRVDSPGLFRIVAGRRPELVERDVVGIDLDDLRLFR